MSTLIKKVTNKLRFTFFPTKQELIVKKWRSDHGDEVLRLNYELNEKSVVVDAGGFEGQWASDIFSKYLCKIYVFEPVLKFYNDIVKRFEKNNSISIIQCGLGGETRLENINISGSSSSTYKKSDRYEEIKIIDFKQWYEDANLDIIDLMKINIEGGEYELLERIIDTRVVQRINNIQVQFHKISNDSQKRMQAIQEKLESTHRLTYQYPFIWENWTKK